MHLLQKRYVRSSQLIYLDSSGLCVLTVCWVRWSMFSYLMSLHGLNWCIFFALEFNPASYFIVLIPPFYSIWTPNTNRWAQLYGTISMNWRTIHVLNPNCVVFIVDKPIWRSRTLCHFSIENEHLQAKVLAYLSYIAS